jgi:hypothetical protein
MVQPAEPPFMPGLELSRLFYAEAVAPALARYFPGLVHGAGRLGSGSEVLGFDTPRSTDHWWGPSVTLFLRPQDYQAELAAEIRRVLSHELPLIFRGFPTHMHEVNRATGTVFMAPVDRHPVNHMVWITTAPGFFRAYLGTNPLDHELAPPEWLAMAEQHLRTVASGGVWHDGTGELTRARAILAWYPHDVWLYVLAAQWRRIEQEEAFPGRCAEVGDELGSRMVAARLVREVMHLAFLLERQYMSYSKWTGSAFSRLHCVGELEPHLLGALAATSWPEREEHLSAAYETVASMHNALGLTEAVPEQVSPFYGRPYRVIHGDRFARALETAITDERVKKLPRYLGNTTQWADSTDVLSIATWFGRFRDMYLGSVETA